MVDIPKQHDPFDWHHVPETTPEQDKAALEAFPAAQFLKERLTMDPETRKLEFEARKAEAETKRLAELAVVTDKVTKQREAEERIVDKEIEREKVKQRRADQPIATADPNSIQLEFAMATDTATVELKYLLHPYLPEKCVVGFYGRGSSAKSSFVASMAAAVSNVASTLWISVEELPDWIKARHIKSGAAEATLQVVKAVAVKQDGQGRTVGSTFNVYEHLEPSIIAANTKLLNVPRELSRPLKLVVLDTAVGLTTWAASAGPSSDEGVKKLMAYLQGLAEKYSLTIAVIGHNNKGKNHDYIADAVMGSAAWVNSPRLSFMHGEDRQKEFHYVAVVVKTNLVWFGVPYKTVPVHTLYKSTVEGVPDSVLVKVEPYEIVWGKQNSDELWKEATTVPKDGDGFTDGRKRTVADIVRDKLVEMVHAGKDEFITREQVECQLPDVKVNRDQWRKVDLGLRQMQEGYKVALTTGPQNMTLYRPIPDPPPT
jgi:AAA domain